jgi:hypothetical protein
MSPLGVKVANILGQVYLGIYHIDSYVLKRPSDWSDSIAIPVTVSNELATWDFDELSRLVFCCAQAGIDVSLHGSFKGYTKMVFMPGLRSIGVERELAIIPKRDAKNLLDLIHFFSHPTKQLGETTVFNGLASETWVVRSPLSWSSLRFLVVNAHHNRVRIAVKGHSPSSLAVIASERKEKGYIYERHPSLDEHIDSLKGLWDIDYEGNG